MHQASRELYRQVARIDGDDYGGTCPWLQTWLMRESCPLKVMKSLETRGAFSTEHILMWKGAPARMTLLAPGFSAY